eukprot:TRINITY_DN88892_c0_g1_i1.p1 TRINITY_DN88892_c0_g1~~TRINITY_DN88892_c0_g1_i1.p1  ORF type:complete len:506 (+),score=30.70 TRINITY_DN88892_c0_g1_i1:197-1714(+)
MGNCVSKRKTRQPKRLLIAAPEPQPFLSRPPLSVYYPPPTPATKNTVPALFDQCCINLLLHIGTGWELSTIPKLSQRLLALRSHLLSSHGLRLCNACEPGLPDECFETKKRTARVLLSVYLSRLEKLCDDCAEVPEKQDPIPLRAINRILDECPVVTILNFIQGAVKRADTDLLAQAVLKFLGKPLSVPKLNFLKDVLYHQYVYCDKPMDIAEVSRKKYRDIIDIVPEELLVPYRELDILETTPSAKIAEAVNAIPLSTVRKEIIEFIDSAVIISIKILAKSKIVYGRTIVGGNILVNSHVLITTMNGYDPIEVAKVLLVLMHEMGHVKRIRCCSFSCWTHKTPERFIVPGKAKAEAGEYCLWKILGLRPEEIFQVMKRMTLGLAKKLVDVDTWGDLAELAQLVKEIKEVLDSDCNKEDSTPKKQIGSYDMSERMEQGVEEMGGCTLSTKCAKIIEDLIEWGMKHDGKGEGKGEESREKDEERKGKSQFREIAQLKVYEKKWLFL